MAFHSTPNYAWQIPTQGTQTGVWGQNMDDFADSQDATVKGIDTVASAALPKAGGTMTGVVKTKGAAETVYAKGNISGAVSFDLSQGQFITCTVTGAVTSVAFTNVPTTGFAVPIILKITNGQTAGAWAWGAAYKWPSATQPVMTVAGVDILGLLTHDGGTTYYQTGITLDVR